MTSIPLFWFYFVFMRKRWVKYLLLIWLIIFSADSALANTWYATNQTHSTLGGLSRWLNSVFSGSAASYGVTSNAGENLFSNSTTNNTWAPTAFPAGSMMPAGTWTFTVRGRRSNPGSYGGWYPRVKIYDSGLNLIYTSTATTQITSTATNGQTITWTDNLPGFALGAQNVYFVRYYSYRTTGASNRTDYLLINRQSSTSNDTKVIDPYTPPTYLARSRGWRWYDDESSLNPNIAYAGENIAPTGMYNHNQIRLRETITEIGGASQGGRKKIQYSSDSVNFTDVGEIGSGAVWAYCNGGGTDDNLVSSLLVSTSSTFGPYVETGIGSSTFNHAAGSSVEYDFCLQENFALVNTTYYFRVVSVTTGVPILPDTGYNWPSILISDHNLSLSVDSNFSLNQINMDDAPGPTIGVFDNLIIRDFRGTSAGWSVTATANDFSDGNGNIIPIDNLSINSSAISPVYAESVLGIVLGNGNLSNTLPLNLATAGNGNGVGNFKINGNLSLLIPIATVPGNYSSVMTITIS